MPGVSTASVVADFVRYRLESSGVDIHINDFPNPALYENVPQDLHEAVVNLSERFMMKYGDTFSGMQKQLGLGAADVTENSIISTFSAVTEEMFIDTVISWGRIIAFLTFGGSLCIWSSEKRIPQASRRVQQLMTSYIDTHLMTWILENGGWEGLIEFYQDWSRDSTGAWSGKQLATMATLGLLKVGSFFFRP
ncbi:bcl-2-like protein 1 [Diadema antillarum]|uniref:bcl-2-like protein 1 n=1 Tax=Diadema antillarum TaxID=105358 RepID=UPI003A8A8534